MHVQHYMFLFERSTETLGKLFEIEDKTHPSNL